MKEAAGRAYRAHGADENQRSTNPAPDLITAWRSPSESACNGVRPSSDILGVVKNCHLPEAGAAPKASVTASRSPKGIAGSDHQRVTDPFGMLSAEIAAFARVVMDVEGRGRQARSDEAVAGVQHSLTLAQVAALFLFGPEGGGREEGARLRFLALSLMVCRDKGGNGTKVLR